jgi:hypothetical protein
MPVPVSDHVDGRLLEAVQNQRPALRSMRVDAEGRSCCAWRTTARERDKPRAMTVSIGGRQRGMIRMDLASLKAKTAEETSRYLLEKLGYEPDPDSDEWEDEYRRRFAAARVQATQAAPRPAAAPPEAPAATPRRPVETTEMAELRGPAAEVRWATALRADRLTDIQDGEIRLWLARTWTAAKSWIDTRELSPADFLRRVEPRFVEHRRQREEEEAALAAQLRAEAAAAAALANEIEAAGITVRGLIELVDVCPRAKVMPARAKLAELKTDERRLRIFETTDPSALLVLDSGTADRSEYGIERDDGLVADLRLFARTAASPP